MRNKTIVFLSFPLLLLLIIVSCVGLFTPAFYSLETLNWQAQSMGQDFVDLFFIAPFLAISSVFAYRNNRVATMIWGGVVIYLNYTFVLYCFDVHFNKLFLLYCIGLGLSFYSLIYFLFSHVTKFKEQIDDHKPVTRFIGIYLIIVAVLFYGLWLAEVLPASFHEMTPKSVTDAGLFTNGVHVIDLSVILPAIFIIGIFLLKKISYGYFLAPAILTFIILMDITIGSLVIIMSMKGIESNLVLAVIMYLLAFFSLSLLIWYFKSFKNAFPK